MKLLTIIFFILVSNASMAQCKTGQECFKKCITVIQKDGTNLNACVSYLKQACDLKHGLSCDLYAQAMLVKGDKDIAKEYYQKGCKLGYKPACGR